MLNIFLSSTFRDLKDARSEILTKLDAVFEGVGMEEFIPKGIKSQEVCISDLKKSDIIIFLISPYYGSLIETCVLKDDCNADKCPMKTGEGQISYTNCEYNITKADGKLHMTYFVQKGWEPVEFLKDLDIKEIEFYSNHLDDLKENKIFEEMPNDMIKHYLKVSKEAWEFNEQVKNDEHIKFIPVIKTPDFVNMVGEHLAKNIVDWHAKKELDFTDFCDRSGELDEILENIDGKVEVWGVGGVGKTTLIQIALLVQKLKGRKILTIGTSKTYASGSGFEDFRKKCAEDQYMTESQNKITIYDVVKALAKVKLIPNAEEIISSLIQKNKIRNFLSKFLREEKNLILFIDDFHFADKDVRELVENVNKIIFSSRKSTGLARKELCIIGIRKEDRNDFINLLCGRLNKNLSDDAKERILKITDGHPISTDLIVRNSEFINFDKLKEFDLKNDLKNVNTAQVEKFLKRIVKEILSNDAFTLLKDLSVLNINLVSNIERESVEESFNINNINECFNELLYSGMFKKREGKEGVYEFSYKHVQDVLEDITNKERHEKAIKYYMKKREIIGEEIDDTVEVLYHRVKSNPTEELVDEIVEIKKKIQPVHYGFKRLIDVGEELAVLVEEKNKTVILVVLGLLYDDLGRFEEAEHTYKEALETYKELADKAPDVYNSDVANTQNNLGVLYWKIKRFEEAEIAYADALGIYRELANTNPDAYNPDVAKTQNNLGIIYDDLGRFAEAEHAYTEALDIRKKLADENPNAYKHDVANTQNNLGVLYWKIKRFAEAEIAYADALGIYRELANTNPDVYKPKVALVQNNFGNLYLNYKRFEEAEHAYKQALDLRKKLADKNRDAYLPALAATWSSLGVLYKNLGKFDDSENASVDALKIYKELAAKNPDAYNPAIAGTQNNLGVLYWKIKKFEGAEHAYKEALEIYKELVHNNPEAYNRDVAKTHNNLGLLYVDLEQFEKAEHSYQEASEIYKESIQNNPEAYKPEVALVQNNLGELNHLLKKYNKAEKHFKEALQVYEQLAEKDSLVYLSAVIHTRKKLRDYYNISKS